MLLSFRLDERPGESHLALDGKKFATDQGDSKVWSDGIGTGRSQIEAQRAGSAGNGGHDTISAAAYGCWRSITKMVDGTSL